MPRRVRANRQDSSGHTFSVIWCLTTPWPWAPAPSPFTKHHRAAGHGAWPLEQRVGALFMHMHAHVCTYPHACKCTHGVHVHACKCVHTDACRHVVRAHTHMCTHAHTHTTPSSQSSLSPLLPRVTPDLLDANTPAGVGARGLRLCHLPLRLSSSPSPHARPAGPSVLSPRLLSGKCNEETNPACPACASRHPQGLLLLPHAKRKLQLNTSE